MFFPAVATKFASCSKQMEMNIDNIRKKRPVILFVGLLLIVLTGVLIWKYYEHEIQAIEHKKNAIIYEN